MDPAYLAVLSVFVCPIFAGLLASKKGRSPVLWAFFGFFLGIFGLLLALLVPSRKAEVY